MTGVVDVQVVRPKRTGTDFVGLLLGQVVSYAINGYLLMLVIGAISSWHPSYAHSVLAVIAARCLVPSSDSSYLSWTKVRKS